MRSDAYPKPEDDGDDVSDEVRSEGPRQRCVPVQDVVRRPRTPLRQAGPVDGLRSVAAGLRGGSGAAVDGAGIPGDGVASRATGRPGRSGLRGRVTRRGWAALELHRAGPGDQGPNGSVNQIAVAVSDVEERLHPTRPPEREVDSAGKVPATQRQDPPPGLARNSRERETRHSTLQGVCVEHANRHLRRGSCPPARDDPVRGIVPLIQRAG